MVGEIGRDRREYLYEMRFWEIMLIIRGYRHRNVLQYQLQRLQAYGAFFAMRGTNHQPHEWLPLYIDKYKKIAGPGISEEEAEDLLKDIEAMNKKLGNPRT